METLITITCIFAIIQSLFIILLGLLIASAIYLKTKPKIIQRRYKK